MRFLKENSYDIVKLYINQLGITIFALIMYTAGGMINSGEESGVSLPLRLGISIFSSLFYFVLIYTAAWDWGAKDKIRIEGNKITRDGFKGVKLALCANVINFILCTAVIMFGVLAVFAGLGWASSVFAVFDMILRFTASMYIGIAQGALSWATGLSTSVVHIIQSCVFLFMAFVSVFVTNWGYRAGLVERKIFSFRSKNKE